MGLRHVRVRSIEPEPVAQPQGALEGLGDIVGTTLEEIPRVAARGAAGFAGVPGEIGQLAETLRPKPTVSEENVQYALTQGLITPEEYERATQSVAAMTPQEKIESERRLAQETRFPELPTTENITQFMRSVVEEPKTELGRRAGEIAELTGRLLFPLGKPISFKRALTAGTAGKAAKWLAKDLRWSDTAGDVAEAAVVMGALYLGQPKTRTIAEKLYDKAKQSLPKEFEITSNEFRKKAIDSLKEWAQEGAPEAVKDKDTAFRIIGALEKNISEENVINLKNLVPTIRDISQSIVEAPSPRLRVELIKTNNALRNIVKNNPNVPEQFAETLLKANSLYSGIRGAEKITSFITRNPGMLKKVGGMATGMIFYMLPPHLKGLALTAGVGAFTIKQIGNLIKNPEFVKAHIQLINSAIKESAPAFIRAANKINKMTPKAQRKRVLRHVRA